MMLWLTSWIAGRWLPLLVLAGCVAGLAVSYGYGRSHANAAWEARWAAQTLKATQAARATETGWQARINAAESELNDARNRLTAYDSQLRLVGDRLRFLATGPRPMPSPAGLAQCTRDLADERQRSDALGSLLAEGGDLARELAAERDDAVARLWSAADAWPR